MESTNHSHATRFRAAFRAATTRLRVATTQFRAATVRERLDPKIIRE